jgi:hypothetical protein
MPHKTYRSGRRFSQALEDRLQDIAKKEAVDLQRIRRQVAIDRLLARLFADGQPSKLPWALRANMPWNCGCDLHAQRRILI